MGTRIELHRFGTGDADALAVARRMIEAVDDALTIHRPSPATALNEALRAGQAAPVDDPLLFDALVAVDAAHRATHGRFDPAIEPGRPGGGWAEIRFDRERARVSPSRPVALDFGGIGKGLALDRAEALLRDAGVTCAFLSAGESSIAVIGAHPLGGAWEIVVPHPYDRGRALVALDLRDEALSISSTVGAGSAAPGRTATIRPSDGAAVTRRRSAVAVARSGAAAEAMSTALLTVEMGADRELVEGPGSRHFVFDHGDGRW